MPDYLEEFLGLPEPRRKWNRIANDLCQGCSVVWMFPSLMTPDYFYRRVIGETEKRGLSFKLLACNDAVLPGSFIAQSLGRDIIPGSLVEVYNIMTDPALPDIVAVLLLNLPSESVHLWARFGVQWAQNAKAYQSRTGDFPKALLLIVNQDEFIKRIQEDVYLKLHYFWGWFSSAEMRLVARSVCSDRGFTLEESLWAESVYAELAGTDPELFFWLLDNCPCLMGKTYITLKLKEFSQNMGWDQNTLTGFNIKETEIALERPLVPPQDLFIAWNSGVINWNSEDGLFVHSAFLAQIGDEDTIEHRIWRGQTRVLLPIIDQVRKKICDYLLKAYPEWKGYCELLNDGGLYPSFGNTMKVTAEFPNIDYFLRKYGHGNVHNLQISVERLRKARNALAHYVSLDWDIFITIVNELVSLIKIN